MADRCTHLRSIVWLLLLLCKFRYSSAWLFSSIARICFRCSSLPSLLAVLSLAASFVEEYVSMCEILLKSKKCSTVVTTTSVKQAVKLPKRSYSGVVGMALCTSRTCLSHLVSDLVRLWTIVLPAYRPLRNPAL